MKTLKKLTSVLLALVMALGLTCTAFATSGSYKISIEGNTTDGYQYTAYQIFAGDVSTYDSKTVLVDITWGSNIDQTQFSTLYEELATIAEGSSYPFKNNGTALTSAADVAAVLAGYSSNSAVAEAFAEVIAKYITGTGTTSGTTSPYSITVNNSGYYLIQTTTVPTDGAYTNYILAVADSASVTANDKSDVPTVDKAVSDLDVNIGDTVTYYLAATLPSNYADYTTYALTFNDELSAGLTYTANSVVVKVFDSGSDYEKYLAYRYVEGVDSTVTGDSTITGTTVASGYTATIGTYNATTGTAITISITDTNALKDGDGNTITVTASSIIAVEFQATLNKNAVIGSTGNSNEVSLRYSNNPNGSGTGTTVKDTVYTWTYKLDVTKTDGETTPTPLEGAKFKLYRYSSDSTPEKEYAVINSTTGAITWTTTEADATVLTSDSSGKITITGLDAGTYYLTETAAPTGYNKLTSDVKLVITANYNQLTSDTDLTQDYNSINTLSATAEVEGTTKDLTATADTGIIQATIVNKAGVAMPSTGGIGTTIFYVVGGVLVVGAVVLLITRKRMGD
ncbi:MAG: isopeptide-forming domain-containing fimbrial protein [Clostridiales bacterium]|nr:isopeptide-forming domain-containing fimbrial protein [Clostridiales bacterium]